MASSNRIKRRAILPLPIDVLLIIVDYVYSNDLNDLRALRLVSWTLNDICSPLAFRVLQFHNITLSARRIRQLSEHPHILSSLREIKLIHEQGKHGRGEPFGRNLSPNYAHGFKPKRRDTGAARGMKTPCYLSSKDCPRSLLWKSSTWSLHYNRFRLPK